MSFLNKILNWFNFENRTTSNDVGSSSNVVQFRSKSNSDELNQLKVSELRSLAKERGLKGYTALRKNELVNLLSQ